MNSYGFAGTAPPPQTNNKNSKISLRANLAGEIDKKFKDERKEIITFIFYREENCKE